PTPPGMVAGTLSACMLCAVAASMPGPASERTCDTRAAAARTATRNIYKRPCRRRESARFAPGGPARHAAAWRKTREATVAPRCSHLRGPAEPDHLFPSPQHAEKRRMSIPDILQQIVETKKQEVAAAKSRVPEADLKARAADAAPPRNFFAALTKEPDG